MSPRDPAETFRLLQDYISWTDDDANRIASLATQLSPYFEALIDDFQQAVHNDPDTIRVIGDDPARIARLKHALAGWLHDLFSGRYDHAYLERRWRVGRVHAEMGLPPFYNIAALCRVRLGLIARLQEQPDLDPAARDAATLSLSRLLDLDLAILEDAYQSAFADKLQRNERLATLGQIAGGIAHELRNPLNVIKTSCYYLRHADDIPPEKLAEHLDRIERQVSLGENVITTLLHLARMPEPATRNVSSGSLIDLALDADPPPAGITIQREFDESLPHVLADPDQLRIALGNLLRNAYEAMDGQGLLVLAAELAGGSPRIRITDSGPGVPPEAIAQIMEPLHSSKPRGLGLGLAIARTILERHRGKLEVSSPPGQGATFTVTLPTVRG